VGPSNAMTLKCHVILKLSFDQTLIMIISSSIIILKIT
jgi:hypothetical protein